MLRNYTPLPANALLTDIGYAQPTQAVPDRVTLDSPAIEVMTDLKRVTAIIILSGDTVDEAHRRMIQRSVRLLLVVDQDRRILGVITANDVLGEKPVQTAVERGIRREEVLVRDVMTPRERLQVLDMEQVRSARVGHVVATLRQAGRQHSLVVDRNEQGRQRLRGIVSATQVARQLGVTIQTSAVANTFSEIESLLAR
ncbi:MAG: CBS domain-containing protein [Betaproteobacteria bacterium]|nr:CBS domain-containing protein [Betaproteobacteria bacterium]